VFIGTVDPVGSGFIDSLARPGGNATGFVLFDYPLAGKWVELLKQITPTVTRVAVRRDAALPAGIGQFAVIQSVAPSIGVDVSLINMRDAGQIEQDITICELPKWRFDLDAKRACGGPPKPCRRACGTAQTARGLPPTLLCHERRLNLLWA
jgi:hypothetical protein